MAVWFDLCINSQTLGLVEIQRMQYLELSDPEAIADIVCSYTVFIDGRPVGAIQHRYGDGVFILIRKAADLLAARVEQCNPRPRFRGMPHDNPLAIGATMAANISVECPTCGAQFRLRYDPGAEDTAPELAREQLRKECPEHGEKEWDIWNAVHSNRSY